MNVLGNHATYYYANENGLLNIMGNHNKIYINQCFLEIKLIGNHNQIEIQNSQIKLCITGNHNGIKIQNGTIRIGITGNHNSLKQVNSQIQSDFNNGNHNNLQGVANNTRIRQNNSRYTDLSNQIRNRVNINVRNQEPYQNQPQTNIVRNIVYSNNSQRSRLPRRLNYIQYDQLEQERQFNEGLTSNQLNFFSKNKHYGTAGKCTICLQDIEDGQNQTFLICFHSFHSHCILQWLQKSPNCPFCQINIRENLFKKV